MANTEREGNMPITAEGLSAKIGELVPITVGETIDGDGIEQPSSKQKTVTDLASRLEELEKWVKKLELIKERTSGDEQDADDEKSSAQDDDKEENDDQAPECEPTYKLQLKPPAISWFNELVYRSTCEEIDDERQPAIAVYYEASEGSGELVERANEELPVRIRINSRRLSTLIGDIVGLSLPRIPYTALPPFRVFIFHFDKFQEKQENLETSFVRDFNQTVNDIACEDPDAPRTSELSHDTEDKAESLEERKQDILLLRSFTKMVKQCLAPLITLQSRINSRTLETISFANLWFLYQPGDIIIGQEDFGPKIYNAYRVFCVTGGRPCLGYSSRLQKDDQRPAHGDLQLHCYSWRYDGSRFVASMKKIFISPFDGDKKLRDLPWVPKQFCGNDNPILRKLISRGQQFQQCRYGHGNYNGSTLPPSPRHINEDVFIDFKSGYEMNPKWRDDSDERVVLPERSHVDRGTWEPRCGKEACELRSCGSFNVDEEALNFQRAERFVASIKHTIEFTDTGCTELEDDHLVMLSPKLLGYGLRSKQWFYLDPKTFRMIDPSVEKRQQAFNDLVLPPDTKRLLKAMVKTHAAEVHNSRGSESVDELDLAKGKGNSLIIFLHGPPGVGKKSTVEAITACSTPARPLYRIMCRDLGYKPVEMQEKLDSHFTLAHRWKCVLLLEETDLRLAERNIAALDRNDVISIFLRSIEHYPVILFLISNCEGLINEAFKSHIHIAIRYKPFDMQGTLKIWRNIMRKIAEENKQKTIPITFDADKLLEWAESHYNINSKIEADDLNPNSTATWNGRQIQNAFQTAIALASFARLEYLEKKELTEQEALQKTKRKYLEIQLSPEHFDTVGTLVGEFGEYLVKYKGHDVESAERERLRKNSHDPAPTVSAYYRGPDPQGVLRRRFRNNFREYPGVDEISQSRFVPSPSPRMRGANVKELDLDEDETDSGISYAGGGSRGWEASSVRDVDDSSQVG